MILATALLPCGCQSSSGAAARGGGGGDGGEGEPEPPDTPTPDDTVAREIEEADIVKYRDGFFYLANRYRGLRIIDARTIERPAIVGGVAMKGRGVELYADEGQAVVVSSADYFSCGGLPVSFEDETIAKDLLLPDYSGSRITAVDVTDPADPVEISHFDMDGFIVATRRVGEVIYAVGNFDGSAGSIDDNDGDPVGDDGGTAPPLADPPPPSSPGAAANVNAAGQAVATPTSPGGLPAEFSVAEAEPGGFIQVKAADGNLWTTLDGLPDAQLLSGTVSVSTDLEDGAFRGVVGV
ncbi:MAG: hypothetical protein GY778_16750, partial [bacterium]|nr:hypothetical protein [bacterium]